MFGEARNWGLFPDKLKKASPSFRLFTRSTMLFSSSEYGFIELVSHAWKCQESFQYCINCEPPSDVVCSGAPNGHEWRRTASVAEFIWYVKRSVFRAIGGELVAIMNLGLASIYWLNAVLRWRIHLPCHLSLVLFVLFRMCRSLLRTLLVAFFACIASFCVGPWPASYRYNNQIVKMGDDMHRYHSSILLYNFLVLSFSIYKIHLDFLSAVIGILHAPNLLEPSISHFWGEMVRGRVSISWWFLLFDFILKLADCTNEQKYIAHPSLESMSQTSFPLLPQLSPLLDHFLLYIASYAASESPARDAATPTLHLSLCGCMRKILLYRCSVVTKPQFLNNNIVLVPKFLTL